MLIDITEFNNQSYKIGGNEYDGRKHGRHDIGEHWASFPKIVSIILKIRFILLTSKAGTRKLF